MVEGQDTPPSLADHKTRGNDSYPVQKNKLGNDEAMDELISIRVPIPRRPKEIKRANRLWCINISAPQQPPASHISSRSSIFSNLKMVRAAVGLGALATLISLSSAKEIKPDEAKAARLYDSGVVHNNLMALKNACYIPAFDTDGRHLTPHLGGVGSPGRGWSFPERKIPKARLRTLY
jgi:hypothetical protein